MTNRLGMGTRIACAAILAACLSAMPALSAHASTGNRIVDGNSGNGTTVGELDNEATLTSYGPYWNSNYALFLQMILWSDGYMADSQVDCKFGPRRVTR